MIVLQVVTGCAPLAHLATILAKYDEGHVYCEKSAELFVKPTKLTLYLQNLLHRGYDQLSGAFHGSKKYEAIAKDPIGNSPEYESLAVKGHGTYVTTSAKTASYYSNDPDYPQEGTCILGLIASRRSGVSTAVHNQYRLYGENEEAKDAFVVHDDATWIALGVVSPCRNRNQNKCGCC